MDVLPIWRWEHEECQASPQKVGTKSQEFDHHVKRQPRRVFPATAAPARLPGKAKKVHTALHGDAPELTIHSDSNTKQRGGAQKDQEYISREDGKWGGGGDACAHE